MYPSYSFTQSLIMSLNYHKHHISIRGWPPASVYNYFCSFDLLVPVNSTLTQWPWHKNRPSVDIPKTYLQTKNEIDRQCDFPLITFIVLVSALVFQLHFSFSFIQLFIIFVSVLVIINKFVIFSFSPFSFSCSLMIITLLLGQSFHRQTHRHSR